MESSSFFYCGSINSSCQRLLWKVINCINCNFLILSAILIYIYNMSQAHSFRLGAPLFLIGWEFCMSQSDLNLVGSWQGQASQLSEWVENSTQVLSKCWALSPWYTKKEPQLMRGRRRIKKLKWRVQTKVAIWKLLLRRIF